MNSDEKQFALELYKLNSNRKWIVNQESGLFTENNWYLSEEGMKGFHLIDTKENIINFVKNYE